MAKANPAGPAFVQYGQPVRIKSIRLTVKGHEERFRVIGREQLPGDTVLYYLRGNSRRQYGMMTGARVYIFLDGVERFVDKEIASALKRVDPRDLISPPTTPKDMLGDLLLAKHFLSEETGSYASRLEQIKRVIDFAIAHELEHRAQSDIPEPAQELAVNLSLLCQGSHHFLAAYHLIADIDKFHRLACSVTALRIFAELTSEPEEVSALQRDHPSLWEGELTNEDRIALIVLLGSRLLNRGKPLELDTQELHKIMKREMTSLSHYFERILSKRD